MEVESHSPVPSTIEFHRDPKFVRLPSRDELNHFGGNLYGIAGSVIDNLNKLILDSVEDRAALIDAWGREEPHSCGMVLHMNPWLEDYFELVEQYENGEDCLLNKIDIETMGMMVMDITGKPLDYFLEEGVDYARGSPQSQFVAGSTHRSYLQLFIHLGDRMLKFLCKSCYHCRKDLFLPSNFLDDDENHTTPNERFWSIQCHHIDAPSKYLEISKSTMSSPFEENVREHLCEITNTVTTCFGCNPRGEDGKCKRKWRHGPDEQLPRSFPRIIYLNGKYNTVSEIIDHPTFQLFLREAKEMKLDHSGEMKKTVGTYGDLKILVGLRFNLVLEDLVGENPEYSCPRVLFNVTLVNIIKRLTNYCPDCGRSTRNVPFNHLDEFHFDHFDKISNSKRPKYRTISSLAHSKTSLEVLIAELRKCTLRCSRCHANK